MNKLKRYTKMAMYSMFVLGMLLMSSSFSSPSKPEYRLNVGEFGIFEYEEVNSEIKILGIREWVAPDDPRVVDMEIPDEIDGKPVVSIGERAFSRKREIKSLTIGSNVRIIEDQAFEWATNLTGGLSMPEVTNIGKEAFNNTKITNLSIPKVKDIGEGAFFQNENLAGELDLPEVINIGGWAFYDSGVSHLNVPKARSIGARAFSVTPNLTGKLDLPMVEEVGAGAFSETGITSIETPNLKIIGDYAFSDNESLTGELDLPNVTSIGHMAFMDTEVTGLKAPKVEIIKYQAFQRVKSLTGELDLPNVVKIEYNAFMSTNITSLKAPKVETIGVSAFAWVNTLTGELDLPAATTIEREAFRNTSITRLNLPKINTVGKEAFIRAIPLKEITIKDSVLIGANAFEGTGNTNSRIVNIVGDNWDGIIAGTGPTVNGYKFTDAWLLRSKYIFTTEEVEGGLIITGLQSWIENDDPRVIDMVIPDEMDGVKVLRVDDEAFRDVSTIESLDIPSSTTSIGNKAFMSAKLKRLDLMNVETIGNEAFINSPIEVLILSPNLKSSENAFTQKNKADGKPRYIRGANPNVIVNDDSVEIAGNNFGDAWYLDDLVYRVEDELGKNPYVVIEGSRDINSSKIGRYPLITIPNQIEGYPIKTVENDALNKDYRYILDLNTDNLEVIGDRAFKGVLRFKDIYSFDTGSLRKIGSHAFDELEPDGLLGMTVQDNIEEVGDNIFGDNFQKGLDYDLIYTETATDESLKEFFFSIRAFYVRRDYGVVDYNGSDHKNGDKFGPIVKGIEFPERWLMNDDSMYVYKPIEGVENEAQILGIKDSYPLRGTSFTIPKKINSYEVSTIGHGAFFEDTVSQSIDFTVDAPYVKRVERFAFNNASLVDINAPEINHVGGYAFARTKLSSINMPKLKTIFVRGFEDAELTGLLSLPEVEEVGGNAFAYNDISEIYLPKARIIKMQAFTGRKEKEFPKGYNKINMDELYLPELEELGSTVFRHGEFRSINLPKVKNIGHQAFVNAETVENLNLPLVEEIGARAFQPANLVYTGDKILSLPNLKKIGDSAFLKSTIDNANVYAPLLKPENIENNAFGLKYRY